MKQLQVGNVFPHSIYPFRIFLFPHFLFQQPIDYEVLDAILAGPCSSLDQVFHELRWDDWFSDIGLGSLLLRTLDNVHQYGLLIVPCKDVWSDSIDPQADDGEGVSFIDMLRRQRVRVQPDHCPPFELTLDMIPIRLAYDCGRKMNEYEGREGLTDSFFKYQGVITDINDIKWPQHDGHGDLSEHDYAIMRAQAGLINHITWVCCPFDYK
jgi:hypothetical protein